MVLKFFNVIDKNKKVWDKSSLILSEGNIKPDDGNDLVIEKDDGSKKVLGSRAYGPYFKNRKSHIKPEKDALQTKAANLR